MSPEQFCYWLQGFAELTDDAPTSMQWSQIKDHLDLVFNKVTPKKKNVITEKMIDEVFGKPVVNPFDRPDVYCAPEVDDDRRLVPRRSPTGDRIC
jgi:hypothetical protein